MTWTAVWSDIAKKQLKKLPKDVQTRILDKVDEVELDPFTYISRLTGTKFFKLRVGDYRLIIDIINDKLLLHILKTKKRSNVYKD
ncbi:type II toxin-antitoxin system RelE/ParE family toxin [Nitrosopumilus sp.]|uniref:type II toxin-antitoxin system RelE/ParE family toxin n=1 Tax=Nitrosopumilus sp. TaxID=2024843 RepID=UPI0034A05C97